MSTKPFDYQKQFWLVYVTVLVSLIFLYFVGSQINLLPLNAFSLICQIIGVLSVLVNISWQLTRLLKTKFFNKEYISPENKAVLITGCDSGFGHHLCRRLDKYGFHVFAGCLFPNGTGANELRLNCSSKCQIIKLDVTVKEDIKNAVDKIIESGLPLWAVVNNAGISHYSLVEWGNDIDVFEKMFSVNLFGLVRITKMCLPLLRLSKGRVINMSSVAGRFSFSGLTAYCMTKFSVRAFSDGLRRELAGHQVKVIALEPNLYRTSITDYDILVKSIDSIWDQTDDEVKQFYGGDNYKERFKLRLKHSLDIARPEIYEVIDAQQEAVTNIDPEHYYRLAGPGERPGLWMLELMPDLVVDYCLTGTVWKRILRFFSTK